MEFQNFIEVNNKYFDGRLEIEYIFRGNFSQNINKNINRV